MMLWVWQGVSSSDGDRMHFSATDKVEALDGEVDCYIISTLAVMLNVVRPRRMYSKSFLMAISNSLDVLHWTLLARHHAMGKQV